MLQLYFLSILLNLIVGYYFIFCQKNDISECSISVSKNLFIEGKTFFLVIGILALVTGLLKFIFPVNKSIVVFGDFIPAAACVLGGFCFLLDYYLATSTISVQLNPVLEMIESKKKYIGVGIMVSAILHFLLPTVLFF